MDLLKVPLPVIEQILLEKCLDHQDANNFLEAYSLLNRLNREIVLDNIFWQTKCRASHPRLHNIFIWKARNWRGFPVDVSLPQPTLRWYRVLEERDRVAKNFVHILETIRERCFGEECERNELEKTNLLSRLIDADLVDIRYPRSDRDEGGRDDRLVTTLSDAPRGGEGFKLGCTGFDYRPKPEEYTTRPGSHYKNVEIVEERSFSYNIFEEIAEKFGSEDKTLFFWCLLDACSSFCSNAQPAMREVRSLLKYARISCVHLQKFLAVMEIRHCLKSEDPDACDIFLLMMLAQAQYAHYCDLFVNVMETLQELARTILDTNGKDEAQSQLENIFCVLADQPGSPGIENSELSPLLVLDDICFFVKENLWESRNVGPLCNALGHCKFIAAFYILARTANLDPDLYRIPLRIGTTEGSDLLPAYLWIPFFPLASCGFFVLPHMDRSLGLTKVKYGEEDQIADTLMSLIRRGDPADGRLAVIASSRMVKLPISSIEIRNPIECEMFSISDFIDWFVEVQGRDTDFYVEPLSKGYVKEVCSVLAQSSETRARHLQRCREWIRKRSVPCDFASVCGVTGDLDGLQPWKGLRFERRRDSEVEKGCFTWKMVLPVGTVVRYKPRPLVPRDADYMRTHDIEWVYGAVAGWEISADHEEQPYRVMYQIVSFARDGERLHEMYMPDANYAALVKEMAPVTTHSDGIRDLFKVDTRLWKYFDAYEGAFLKPHEALLEYFPDDLSAQEVLKRVFPV